MIVAGGQDTLSHGKRHVFELRPIQLFNSGIICVAIHVYDCLREVSTKLKLGNVFVGLSEVVGGVCLEELLFTCENSSDLLRQLAVLCLFVVEKLGPLGGVVDDF